MKKLITVLIISLFGGVLLAAPSEFDRADTNHDGFVSKTEWEAYQKTSSKTSTPAKPNPDPWNDSGAKTQKPARADIEGPATSFIEKNFSLHKSFLSGKDEDATSPAKVTWTHAIGAETYYHLDLAITPKWAILDSGKIDPKGVQVGNNTLAYSISPVVEAHVSSEPKHAQNKLDYEMAIDLRLSSNDTSKMIKGWELLLTPEYQTDRHDLVRIAKGDILTTFSAPYLGIGVAKPILHHVDFYWRPFVGVELNHDIKNQHVLDDGTLRPATDQNYGWLKGHILAELRFYDTLSFTADYIYRAGLYGGAGTHGYLELGGNVFLDPARHYTAGITYTRGEDGPEFKHLNKVEGWVGVQF